MKPGTPSLRATNASSGGEIKRALVPASEDWKTVVVQRAVFQSLASMALPAFTIHSIVRYSGKAMKNVKNARLRTWGPIGVCDPISPPCLCEAFAEPTPLLFPRFSGSKIVLLTAF